MEYTKPKDELLVNLDIIQFSRVLTNIVENSLKYSKAENLKIDFEIFRMKSSIFLTVKDNGLGIESENLEKIFEQFYRIDESRSSKNSNGNGLGLYIAKYILEFHNAKIWAENDNGLKIVIEFEGEQ